MSERNWGLIAAAGLGVVSFSAVSGFMLATQTNSQYEQPVGSAGDPDQRRDQPQQADTDHAGVPSAVERLISNPEPDEGTQREKRDLAAQENTAAWAFWMVFLTTVQAFLSAAGIYFIVKTLRHSQDVAYHQLRAYVTFGQSELTELAGKLWKIVIPIKNSGQTPACKVQLRALALKAAFPILRSEVNGIWDTVASRIAEPIGPSLELSMRFTVAIPDEEMRLLNEDKMCIFVRMQVIYATYTGERIEEPTIDWIGRGSEFDAGSLARTDPEHYADESGANQPRLL